MNTPTNNTHSNQPRPQQRLPIGTSDFLQLRREGLRYVDKSGLITEVMRASDRILLLPRPRRFGKTLALSTLAAYLERTAEGSPERAEREGFFQDLAVWRAGDDMRGHFGRYPTIFLSFKDVKERTWANCRAAVAGVIADLCERLEPTLRSHLSAVEQRRFDALLMGDADLTTLSSSLAMLSRALHRVTGELCVILTDEYDTPLHAALQHGYYEDAIEFFRNLLSGAYKDNSHLKKGVITGILHITKESIFSGLNNLTVATILAPEFNQHFGFTPEEVALLAQECGVLDKLAAMERWYNGYNFGGQTMYNPWSVLMFLSRPQVEAQAYWINTASDALLRELLVDRGAIELPDLAALLHGESVEVSIDEHIVLRDLRTQPEVVWSLLLFSGYLCAEAPRGFDLEGRKRWLVRIPNREVRLVYRQLFARFLREGLGRARRVEALCGALLAGDGKTFGRLLGALLKATVSYHDLARSPDTGRTPETVYQAFLLGLLVSLEANYHVRSNREAGYGRYDILVAPRTPGQAGAVLELKVIDTEDGETAETALASAMKQLREKDYAAELREQGAEPVVEMGAVFDGKRVWVAVG